MKCVNIIGIGMGNRDTLTIGALGMIQSSSDLIGAKRMLEMFDDVDCTKTEAIKATDIVERVKALDDSARASVLMSGDTGFYSGCKNVSELLEQEGIKIEIFPGISSIQYFASRTKMSWDDARILSLHGRDENYLSIIKGSRKTFILTDSRNTPAEICRGLTDAGMGYVKVYVGERLSYRDEKIICGTADEMKEYNASPLCVAMIVNENAEDNPITTHGISDDSFIRGQVPMTKEEVRSVTVSKLNIRKNDIVYDIGAGTGSVSVEMAAQANGGRVYAIETDEEAVELIKQNREKFSVFNLSVIEGMAPEAMEELPAPDRAYIGGSKGEIDSIIKMLLEKNPKVRIVINVIALESLNAALEALKKSDVEIVDIVQISVAKARKAGRYNMMIGQNPIYIITGQRKEECYG